MPARIAEIDAYIAAAQPFAKPILKRIRKLIHQACPDVEEKIKWSFPHFDYQGMMCSMAAFKAHAVFGFWKAKLLDDPHGWLGDSGDSAMGDCGKMTSVSELPPDEVIVSFIHQAMELNVKKVSLPRPKPSGKLDLIVPPEFSQLLNGAAKSHEFWQSCSYSCKKEYLQWFAEAKREVTQTARMKQAIEWLADGKGRNWKYER